MCGGMETSWGRLEAKRTWQHSVSVHCSGPEQTAEILVDGQPTRVVVRADEVRIGCTTVSREAIFRLKEFFDKHFPNDEEVVVQCPNSYYE